MKKPHASSTGAQKTAPLLAKDAISPAWEGSLAYGISADYSGGTAADSHGLPRFPCLQIGFLVYAARLGVSIGSDEPFELLAVFPVGLAFFDERPQTFLRIFQPVQFVQENIHRVFQPIAQRQSHSA